MPAGPHASNDLYGSAPDSCPLALLLIDVINDLEFPGSENLLRYAEPAARKIADLRRRASQLQVPVIYVNDNFGHWRSDLAVQVRHCLEDGVKGELIARILQPSGDDYFILKPMHSGFYQTPLSLLLESLQARVLILTGIAGNICVLFTANDAYMRQYDLVVPADCIASESEQINQFALDQMRTILKADTTPSDQLDLEALMRCCGERPSN